MARLGRRQHFKPIIQGLIKYQPVATAPPVARKPLVASFAAVQASESARHQRYPLSRLVVRNGLIRYSAPASTPPTARKPYLVTQIARDIAKFRGHVLHHPAIVPPAVPPIPPHIRPKFFIQHDEKAEHGRSRKHEQDVAELLNNLSRDGRIIGSIRDPDLGYLAADPTTVGTTDVLPIADVLDQILANLKALNAAIGGPVPVAATVPVTDESTDPACFVGFYTSPTGNQAAHSNAAFLFNAATATLVANHFDVTTDFKIAGLVYLHNGGITTSVFLGPSSGNVTASGGFNNAIGPSSMASLTSGAQNNAFGAFALFGVTTGSFNNAIGINALKSLSTGSQNVAVGQNAIQNHTTGDNNVAVGASALTSNTTQSSNVAVGFQSLFFATASENTAVGSQASFLNTTGTGNVTIGVTALADVTTGTYNVAVGYNTGRGITTGGKNTIVGAKVSGLSATLANTVILADGDGNIRVWVDSSGNGVVNGTTAGATWQVNAVSSSTIAGIYKGAASRTAPLLQLQTSAGASVGNVGGVIFNDFTDTSTTHTDGTEDDLYSYTIAANTFAINGDAVWEIEHVQFVASATAARRLKKYFAGTLIFDSGALTLTLGGDFTLETVVIRESSSVVRVTVNVVTTSASSIPYATYTRITGLTLTGTNILKTTGIASGAGAASGDIVNKLSKVSTLPAA